HHVISRTKQPGHPDDTGKEDVVALEPSEQTVIYRRFRTFLGNYVGHCHNLAHEDHNMMFGWTIIKPL
ncbi:MAG TPA: multicopper oxidase domain-containing protein, partial [Kofleriaceae bacterium]|nr:multicopper oxidase domain-containing protein [Kofleriaceae bacterium]